MRADVQGLRGIAVLLVIAYHAGLPVPGGFAGVDVFFVISGFVITGSILRDLELARGFSLSRFYGRRVRRLLPALALVVSVVTAFCVVLQSAPALAKTRDTALAAVLSLANVQIERHTGGYFDAPAGTNPLLHTWSLSVEEQFYLAFPLLLLASWRLGTWLKAPRRTAVVLLGAAALASYAVAARLVAAQAPPDRPAPAVFAFYSSFTRAWELLAGAVLALCVPLLSRLPAALGTPVGLAGAALLAASARHLDGTSVPAQGVLLPVLGAAGVLVAGVVSSSVVTRLLSARPLVAVGDVSYSLYLWHWPPIVLAASWRPGARDATLVAAVVSVIPALLSHRWVEQPIRRRQLVPQWSGIRLGAALVAASSLLVAAPAAASQRLSSSRTASFTTAVTASHLDVVNHCDSPYTARSAPPARCVFNAAEKGTPVYVAGDSQVAMWSEGIVAAARTLRRPVVIGTQHACPWVVPDRARGCPDLEPAWAWLAAQPAGVVVFAVESDSYVDQGRGGVPGATAAARSASWTAALRLHLQPLLAAGHRVVLIAPAPRFYGWSPLSCAGPTTRRDPESCGTTRSRASAERARSRALAAEQSAARLPGVSLLDPFDELCDPSVCRTNAGSRWLERDADHVTVTLSRSMSDVFASLLSR